MSSRLGDLRLAYSTFTNIQASIQGIVTELLTPCPRPGIGGMLGTILDLEAQDWPSRLGKASEELKQVCVSATILPLSLLRYVRTRACSTGSLITRYKTTFSDLLLSPQTMGEASILAVQPLAQIMTPVTSFSSTDRMTF